MRARYAVIVHTISNRSGTRIGSQTIDAHDKEDANTLARVLVTSSVSYSRETELVIKFPTRKGWVTLPVEHLKDIWEDLKEAVNDA